MKNEYVEKVAVKKSLNYILLYTDTEALNTLNSGYLSDPAIGLMKKNTLSKTLLLYITIGTQIV